MGNNGPQFMLKIHEDDGEPRVAAMRRVMYRIAHRKPAKIG